MLKITLLFAMALQLFHAIPAEAQDVAPFEERSTGEQIVLVTGSVLGSVVYTPVKAVYAAGGTIAGGLVFLMSAGQSSTAASRIMDRAGRGDWYIRPQHFTGEEPLQFQGDTYGPPATDW